MTQTQNRALILSVPVMKCGWFWPPTPLSLGMRSHEERLRTPWAPSSPSGLKLWQVPARESGCLFQWNDPSAFLYIRSWFSHSFLRLFQIPSSMLNSPVHFQKKNQKTSKKEVHQLLQSLYCFFLRRSKGHRQQGHRCRSLKQQLHLSFSYGKIITKMPCSRVILMPLKR